MTVAVYTQGRRLQNHIARIGRYVTNVKSPDFGKYYLDVVMEYGTSRNSHGLHTVPSKDVGIIYEWLDEHGFKKVEPDN
jgi:hypothetical protein